MTNSEIIALLRRATTQQEVNLLRTWWVRKNRDDTLFDLNVPEGLN